MNYEPKTACAAADCKPAMTINDLVIDIITTLSDANFTVNSIYDNMFSLDQGTNSAVEPCTLEQRLYLAQALSQELRNTLNRIRGRL